MITRTLLNMLSKQEQLANPFPAGSKKLNLTYKAIKMLKLANIWIIKENPLPVGQENPNSRAETWFTQCVAHHRPQLGNLFSLVCRDNKRAKLQTHYKICLIRLGFLFGTEGCESLFNWEGLQRQSWKIHGLKLASCVQRPLLNCCLN